MLDGRNEREPAECIRWLWRWHSRKAQAKKGNASPLIVQVVGAGGKTTFIDRTAREAAEQGARVLILTTTHRYAPEALGLEQRWRGLTFQSQETAREALLTAWGQLDRDRRSCLGAQTEERMEKQGDCRAAWPGFVLECGVLQETNQGKSKLGWIGEEAWDAIGTLPDLILIEADGSRGLPLKLPEHWEPALRNEAELTVLVLGLSALGRTISQACHRPQLVGECLRVPEEEQKHSVLGEEALCRVAVCYGQQLPEPCLLLWSQAETKDAQEAGLRMAERLLSQSSGGASIGETSCLTQGASGFEGEGFGFAGVAVAGFHFWQTRNRQ